MRIAICIITISFFSCKLHNNSEVYSLLERYKAYIKTDSASVILLVNESNCIGCVESVVNKMEKSSEYSNIEGIYFSNDSIGGINRIKKSFPNIRWKVTNNSDIFIWVADMTNSKDGPYILKFINKELVKASKLY